MKKERKLGVDVFGRKLLSQWGRMNGRLARCFSDVSFHIKSSGGVIESAQVKAGLPIRMLQCAKFET